MDTSGGRFNFLIAEVSENKSFQQYQAGRGKPAILNQLFSATYFQKVSFYISGQKNCPTVVEETKESNDKTETVVTV